MSKAKSNDPNTNAPIIATEADQEGVNNTGQRNL